MNILDNSETVIYTKGSVIKYSFPKLYFNVWGNLPRCNSNYYNKNTIYNEDYDTEVHYINCKVHSDNDLPAIITKSGNNIMSQIWCYDGVFHRTSYSPEGYINPAIIIGKLKFYFNKGQHTSMFDSMDTSKKQI